VNGSQQMWQTLAFALIAVAFSVQRRPRDGMECAGQRAP
jgi:hypothetical protein